jgi:hypothetical protein
LVNQSDIGIRCDGENDGREKSMGGRQIPEVQRTRRRHDARAMMPKPRSQRPVGGSANDASRMDERARQCPFYHDMDTRRRKQQPSIHSNDSRMRRTPEPNRMASFTRRATRGDMERSTRRYYKKKNFRKTDKRWMAAMITKMWQVSWDLWEHRNGFVHEPGQERTGT